MRNIFSISLHRRLASITVIGACVLCFLPQEGICLAFDKNEPQEFVHEMLSNIEEDNSDLLIAKFDVLEESIEASEDPFDEGRVFLKSFIEEINLRYGMNLTFRDACTLVRDNLHTLGLSKEIRNIVLTTLELMESDSKPTPEQIQNLEQITKKEKT